MTKFKHILAFATLLPATVFAFTPQENKEYEILPQTLPVQDTVIEFFSFNCSSCYNYQFIYQIPQKIKASLKEGEKLRYVNVDAMLGAGTITQAWALASVQGKEDMFLNELYYGLQTSKNIKDAEDIKKLFIKNLNIDEKQFFALWDSATVLDNKALQISLAKQANIKHTPTFVVKGKYVITPNGFDVDTHEAFIEQFIETVDYLKKQP